MKKLIFKCILTLVLAPIVIVLLLGVALYVPPIQNWAVHTVAEYASEKSGKHIEIEHVCLVFPLNLGIDGVLVTQPNDSIKNLTDTVAQIRNAVIDVQLRPLFDSNVEIDRFEFYGMKVNTENFIPDLRVKGTMGTFMLASHGIELKRENVRLDNVYLADAKLDVALSDTVPEDTTKKENNWKISLDRLRAKNADVTVHLPGDSVHINARFGDLAVKQGGFDLAAKKYKIGSLDLADFKAGYRDNNIDINGIGLKSLAARLDIDLNALENEPEGRIYANMKAVAAKSDLPLRMSGMPKGLYAQWPDEELTMRANLNGNMKQVTINDLGIELPTAFHLNAKGEATNPTDIKNLIAKLHLDAKTYNIDFAKAFLDRSLQHTIGLPQMSLSADIGVNKLAYTADFNLTEGKGSLKGKAAYDTKNNSYSASIAAQSLQLQHFVRGMGLGNFSAKAEVKGHGTNLTSAATRLIANATVTDVVYDQWRFNNLKINANLQNGHATAHIDSRNRDLNGTIDFDALLNSKMMRATLAAELNKLDLYKMRIAEAPLLISACAHIDVATDMGEYYMAQGLISDLTIIDSVNTYRPDDMVLDVLTRRDTTHAVVDCGDFHLRADTHGGYKYLMGIGGKISNEIQRQVSNRIIDEHALRAVLPVGNVYLSTGMENPVARTIRRYGYDYHNLFIDVTSSPQNGLNGTMQIDTLRTDGMQIDGIHLDLSSDSETMRYDLKVQNGPDNPQYSFMANAKGKLLPNGTTLWLGLDDDKGKRGLEISLAAEMEKDGIRMRFDDRTQNLGYKDFTVNKDNYVFFANNMRVSADVKMKSADRTGILIYTDDTNEEALQDVTLSLQNFDIEKLLTVVPYTPNMKGTLNGDFHVIITPENLSVSSGISIDKFIFENSVVGNIATDFVYIPLEDGSHHIDGLLMKDNQEIGTIIGKYNPSDGGNIDATIQMNEFPLNIANGFVPNKIVGLDGLCEGELTISGPLNSIDVNGELLMLGASLVSVPYGVKMRFDDDPVRIKNSRLLLENFQMYSNNDQPLIMYGYVDFADFNRMSMDVKMRARNFLLVDAKETRRSEAYGKAFVNFDATMKGMLDHLNVKGQLDVLPTTDLYYILRDSPITTDNRLKELVSFTDFSDNDSQTASVKPAVDGLNMNMNVNVAAGSHIKCWMNTNHTNYLDIFPEGELNMGYLNGDITLTGRCTISEGEMKYSLPIIPLKTFKITDGSYIEFTGNMMNPRLNITALEENRTTVSVNDVNQTVLFNCGVVISKTLEDMGLEFVIEAPENQTVSDELNAMSMEERGKLAVTMLTTGMYLSEGNTQNFTMNSALSAFLQQEINRLAGSALRTLDLSVGLENSLDETGRSHTDYSFKFAKRFWNNRLAISVGGKISTGPDVTGQNKTFFDNVEVQYRLSDMSNQYLQLFYKRAVYDFLEGYVGQYGAGYMWKRKLQNFRDIFQFGDRDLSKPLQFQPDTLKQDE